jgi:hypothetical protein
LTWIIYPHHHAIGYQLHPGDIHGAIWEIPIVPAGMMLKRPCSAHEVSGTQFMVVWSLSCMPMIGYDADL